MDLSFARFDRLATVLPTDLAVLLGRSAARQASGTTARVHARLARVLPRSRLLAPAEGAFDLATARLLRRVEDG